MQSIRRKTGNVPGFTLVELLVVISIISLLMAILLPSLKKARESAMMVVCLSNQRQCGLAFGLYANDYNDYTLSPQPEAARNERYWPDTLMRWNYLPNYTVYQFVSYQGAAAVTLSAVKEKNPFSCPAVAPPATHVYSGFTLPIAGTRASSALCYGMRQIRNDLYDRYDGEQYDKTTGIPRLSTLSNMGPYLADSLTLNPAHSGQTPIQYTYLFMVQTIFPGEEYDGAIDRRHLEAANFWFPDGSAKSMNQSAIEAMPNVLGYPLIPIYSIP